VDEVIKDEKIERAPVLNELKEKAASEEKKREAKRQEQEKNKKSAKPMFEELKTKVEKKSVNVNPVV
jgi:hypothetical protein